MKDLTFEEKQKFNHKPLTYSPHIVTPRIFKSTTIELLEKAKRLYNSDKSPLAFTIKSNVDMSTTKYPNGDSQ